MDLPPGHKAFPNRWVFAYVSRKKTIDDVRQELTSTGLSHDDIQSHLDSLDFEVMEKARLVVRGDLQREGIDYQETA